MVNVERLQKELEFITAHPEEWDQEIYVERTACGTTGCLAGNTVRHEGHELVWQEDTFTKGVYQADELTDGREIVNVASDILDLTVDQADLLFSGFLSLGLLWKRACDVTNGAIEIPPGIDIPEHDDAEW